MTRFAPAKRVRPAKTILPRHCYSVIRRTSGSIISRPVIHLLNEVITDTVIGAADERGALHWARDSYENEQVRQLRSNLEVVSRTHHNSVAPKYWSHSSRRSSASMCCIGFSNRHCDRQPGRRIASVYVHLRCSRVDSDHLARSARASRASVGRASETSATVPLVGP